MINWRIFIFCIPGTDGLNLKEMKQFNPPLKKKLVKETRDRDGRGGPHHLQGQERPLHRLHRGEH